MDETGTCGDSRRAWPWPGAFPTSPFGLYFLWGLEALEDLAVWQEWGKL